jgi:hypothetical protein
MIAEREREETEKAGAKVQRLEVISDCSKKRGRR